jgi:hypothetical protein
MVYDHARGDITSSLSVGGIILHNMVLYCTQNLLTHTTVVLPVCSPECVRSSLCMLSCVFHAMFECAACCVLPSTCGSPYFYNFLDNFVFGTRGRGVRSTLRGVP